MRNRYIHWITAPLLGLAICGMLLGCGAKKEQEIERNTGRKMDTQKLINDPTVPEAVREGLKNGPASTGK